MHCQCFLKEHRTIQELQFAQENDPFFYYMASLKMSNFVKLHKKIKKYKNFHLPTSQWIVFKSYSNSFFLFWLRDWFEWIGFWPFDNQIYILILNLDTGFKIWRKLHFFTLVSNTFQENWGFWRNFGLGFLVWFRFHEKKNSFCRLWPSPCSTLVWIGGQAGKMEELPPMHWPGAFTTEFPD